MLGRNIKVGIFVLIGLAVMGVLVFLIGDERHMFERQARLHAIFHDVAGLKVGSPVRMGGVDVGHVETITFGETRTDRNIHVHFTMVASLLPRVRADSVVTIVGKGLLGDKALDITMGSENAQPVADGGTVRGQESDDMAAALHNAGEALGRANQVLDNVVIATRPLANPQLGNDMVAMAHDLRTITHSLAEGPGTMHTLLTDNTTAQRLEQTLASTQSAANRFAASAGHIEAIAREARTGHGLVHALVYDREGEAMVRSLVRLSEEVSAITHDVRTGDGGLHQIIYGQDSAQVIANANQATASLRDILADVRSGRGTVGALLTDPSLYEDMKSLVGNVQRNEILRAMVRYSIHQDEARPPAVSAQPPATTTPSGTR